MTKNTETGQVLCSDFNYIYDQLAKFNKSKKESEDKLYNFVNKNGTFYFNEYKYYIRKEYTMKIVDTEKLKKNYPEAYNNSLKIITIKSKLIRSLSNGKYHQ